MNLAIEAPCRRMNSSPRARGNWSSIPPAVAAEMVPAPEPKAEVVMAAAEAEYEDELDVPAYLRQGKLVS